MLSMDPDYVEVYLDALRALRKKFKRASSLRALKPLEAEIILEKFQSPNHVLKNFFRRKRHDEYRIEGALEALAESNKKKRRSKTKSITHDSLETKRARNQKSRSVIHLKSLVSAKDDILENVDMHSLTSSGSLRIENEDFNDNYADS